MSVEILNLEDCRQRLLAGLDAMGLDSSDSQQQQWLDYLSLLLKWNKAYNLTAVKDPLEMVSRHLLDSLSLTPFLPYRRLIDVGTGPGLPGIPLAIFFPEKSFTLLDSNGKRTRFLQQVKLQLGLDNVEILHCRTEQHRPEVPYEGVLSRAFASITDMLDWTGHLCAPEGRFLAMKGQYPQAEIDQLAEGYRVEKIEILQVPGSDAERHLVIIAKT